MDRSNKTLVQLKLLNWNANGIKMQQTVFTSFLVRHSIDIACVSETHLTHFDKIKIVGYNTYRTDREARFASGGVAIFVKRNIIHHECQKINTINLETVGVKIKISDGSTVNIICVYRQPNKQLLEEDISTIFNTTEPTLLIGDLNSKNTIWGCRVSNPAGNKLYNLTTTNAFQIEAPGEPTYYPYRVDHKPDILDIIAHKNFNKKIYQQVLMELDSDHVPVIISFILAPAKQIPEPRLINGRVCWNTFRATLDQQLKYPNELLTPNQIDETIEHVTKSIAESIKTATKVNYNRKQTTANMSPKHILDLIKQKSTLRREWQRTRNPNTKNMVNNLSHRIKNELDSYRIESYQKHISNLEPGDPGLWKTTRRILRQRQEIPSIISGTQTFNSDEEKCEVFADHLEKTFTSQNHQDPTFRNIAINYIETHQPIAEANIKPTSPRELDSIIKSLSINKSPGNDKIPNIVLKNLTKKALAYLASIFNACLRNGYFPNIWKHAIILMFPKPSKNKKDVTSYRPISLLNTTSKLFEKIIYSRLNEEIRRLNILPTFQFGFREGHSTCHQLQRVTETIERGFESKQYTTTLFLDIAQAFDRVWTEGLKYKILRLQIPDYIKATLFSFLENRSFAVKIHISISTTRNIHSGVPQGSILGPVLFNIFMCDFPNINADLAMFADDTVILTRNEHLEHAIFQLQAATNILSRWFKQWNLSINYSKCVTKIFSLRRINKPPLIIINGYSIKWNANDEPVKYLGIYLDTRLTWRYHIMKKLNEGHMRLIQLYSVMNRKSSLKIECATLLYKSLIRPLVLYGCVIWGNTSKTNLNRIQALQNKILRIAVNAPWYITNQQLHYELGMSTVQQHISKLTRKFHENLVNCSSAAFYELGQRRIHTRLKRNLPQDIYLSDDQDD